MILGLCLSSYISSIDELFAFIDEMYLWQQNTRPPRANQSFMSPAKSSPPTYQIRFIFFTMLLQGPGSAKEPLGKCGTCIVFVERLSCWKATEAIWPHLQHMFLIGDVLFWFLCLHASKGQELRVQHPGEQLKNAFRRNASSTSMELAALKSAKKCWSSMGHCSLPRSHLCGNWTLTTPFGHGGQCNSLMQRHGKQSCVRWWSVGSLWPSFATGCQLNIHCSMNFHWRDTSLSVIWWWKRSYLATTGRLYFVVSNIFGFLFQSHWYETLFR